MQIKIFTIPILDGEAPNDELNRFLRSKKVLRMEQFLTGEGYDAYWTFCVEYLDGPGFQKQDKPRKDYSKILDEAGFARFSKMREIRKQISDEEGIPAYAIFTDKELAALAKLEVLSLPAMKSVQGIGDMKIEKYASRFIQKDSTDEKSEPTA